MLGAATRKAQLQAFLCFDLFFGVERGEQPLLVRREWSPEDERGASKRPSCPLAQRSVTGGDEANKKPLKLAPLENALPESIQ